MKPFSRRITRAILVILIVLFVLASGLVGLHVFAKHKYEHERVQWKDRTLKRLSLLSITNEEISQEFFTLKSGSKPGLDLGWAGENVLVMTNGEYIIYAFRHGFNNGFVNHLLLGHASDGRWLYSTYHFHAPIEGSDAPPGSINEFAQRYSAKEFDGKSDVCLQKTWPPEK